MLHFEYLLTNFFKYVFQLILYKDLQKIPTLWMIWINKA